jgi:GT2 family glycosyltransferase
MKIRVSVVTFEIDAGVLGATLNSLKKAAMCLPDVTFSVVLVNNGSESDLKKLQDLAVQTGLELEFVSGHGNVGYGAAHNLAIDKGSNYHLVLNPDVELSNDSLRVALAFMEQYPNCGLLSPRALDDRGSQQFLCKKYPSLLDLLLRGFAPQIVKKIFATRLASYEMRSQIGDGVVWNPEIVSGCFMFFRAEILRRIGGFDSLFFLYFEDFDISLRAAETSSIAYVPNVRIVHHGGNAARKGLRHVKLFGASAFKFFSKHGWKLW